MKIPKILLFLFVLSVCFGSPNSFYFFNETDAEYRQLNNPASISFIEEMDSRGYDYKLKPFHYYDMENVSYEKFSYQFVQILVVVWDSDIDKVHIEVWNLGERVYESIYWQKNYRTDEKMAEQIALDLDYFVKSSDYLWEDSYRRKKQHKLNDGSGVFFNFGLSSLSLYPDDLKPEISDSYEYANVEEFDGKYLIPSFQANCFIKRGHFLLDIEFARNVTKNNDFKVVSLTGNYIHNLDGIEIFGGIGSGVYFGENLVKIFNKTHGNIWEDDYNTNGNAFVTNAGFIIGSKEGVALSVMVKYYWKIYNFKDIGSNYSIGFNF